MFFLNIWLHISIYNGHFQSWYWSEHPAAAKRYNFSLPVHSRKYWLSFALQQYITGYQTKPWQVHQGNQRRHHQKMRGNEREKVKQQTRQKSTLARLLLVGELYNRMYYRCWTSHVAIGLVRDKRLFWGYCVCIMMQYSSWKTDGLPPDTPLDVFSASELIKKIKISTLASSDALHRVLQGLMRVTLCHKP